MLTRWDTRVADINNFVRLLHQLCPEVVEARRPGRPPKHSLREYTTLVAAKEEHKFALRRAETELSEGICGERVDHSVVYYWENKLEEVFTSLVRRVSSLLKKKLRKSQFHIIDSTKFSTWKHKTVEFHTQTTVCKQTVFPTSVFFGSTNPSRATKQTLVVGKGELMADRWYDDNKAIQAMYEAGYQPIVKPNSGRYRGHYRRKARKAYYSDEIHYRQRGRGESPYGSLTNSYGNRLNTRLKTTTRTRIAARITNYLVKLYIRASKLTRIIRHALPYSNVYKVVDIHQLTFMK